MCDNFVLFERLDMQLMFKVVSFISFVIEFPFTSFFSKLDLTHAAGQAEEVRMRKES